MSCKTYRGLDDYYGMYSMLVTEGAGESVFLGGNMTSKFMCKSCREVLDSTKYGKYNSEHT